MAQVTYYEMLGVPVTASLAEIRKAYRTASKKCHPDACQNDRTAEERFKTLGEILDVLTDDKKRQFYDASLIRRRTSRDSLFQFAV